MLASRFVRLIAFLGIYFSSFFAFFQIFNLIFEPQRNRLALFLIFILAIIIFYISKIIRKKNPARFLGHGIRHTSSYFVLSLSLSFFLLSIFQPGIKTLWQEFTEENAAIVTLSQTILALTVQFSVVIIAVFPVFLLWFFYSKNKGFLINFGIALVYVLFFLVLLPYLAATEKKFLWIDPDAMLDYFTNTLVPKLESILYILVSFIVGSVPLGWFYELFIATVHEKSNRK